MRVQASVDQALRQPLRVDPTAVKSTERSATTTPITMERETTNGEPVLATSTSRFTSRNPPPQVPQVGIRRKRLGGQTEDAETQRRGFTQPVEGPRTVNSADKLELSSAARRISANEGQRTETDAKEAVASVGTTSPTATATLATLLDVQG